MEICYCCNNHEASEYTSTYGVPICVGCHMGIALMSFDKPSKESIDKHKEKMFNNVDRIKKALAKYGTKWEDPRTDKRTSDPFYNDLIKGLKRQNNEIENELKRVRNKTIRTHEE